MFSRVLIMLALAFCLGGVARPPGAAYEVRPVLTEGRLTALAFELRTAGDMDGETRLRLPTSGVADGEGPAYLRDLEVTGGQARPDGPAAWIVSHTPGARLTVRWRLVSGYEGDPPGQPFRPVVRPEWFVVHGQAAFVTHEGRPDSAAELRWAGMPKGWLAQSNLQDGDTVETLFDSLLFGGAGWRRDVRPLGRATLTLYHREAGWKTSPAVAADMLAAVLMADFDYWRDRPRDMVVPVIQVSGGDFGGRGLSGGFMLFAGPNSDLRSLRRIVAHEHTHSWISRQIGGFPLVDDNLSAWLNEGFTEALAARALLRSGQWTTDDFAADLNASLLRYGLSPAVTASNRWLADNRSKSFDADKMFYDRGRLLALLWERRFREASRGRLGLDAVLAAQRRSAAINARNQHFEPANELFPWVSRSVTGVDLSDDVARFVERGERIELPADLFGACGKIVEVRQPAFERGFDLMATMRNGRKVTGLIPGGPAERAGLKAGDRIRVSEIPSHDSQTPLTYRVVDEAGATLRIITYLPVGEGEVRFQKLVLTEGLWPSQVQACSRTMSGLAR